MSTFTYMKTFVADKYVASITPTSEFGVRKVCGKIDIGRCDVAVEYGPGTGVFSRYLLERLGKNATLVLIERNARFADILAKKLRDPRVVIRNDCASRVREVLGADGLGEADLILSGIPFSFLPYEMRSTILRNSYDALREGGSFLAYQTFYQARNHLQEHLDRIFQSVRVDFEMLNIPPIRIYQAMKRNGVFS